MSGMLARYQSILSRVPRARITVAGDLVADEFIYGQIQRVSREAPVLILGYDSTEIVPGGAGNAANNAAALGARVNVVGVVGKDDPGTRLLDVLAPRADVKNVVSAKAFSTPVKTRILAGGAHSAKQQVVRIDRAGGAASPAVRAELTKRLGAAIDESDAVILSDYGGGWLTPELWKQALAAARRRTPPRVVVDSRYALGSFTGMTACTPNESEVEALFGIRIDDNREMLEKAGRMLLERLGCEAVLITRGSRGMALFERELATDHIPIVGSDEVADVTGAGDTVIATFTLALAAGATLAEAARLANYAGGLVVMKRGTATITRDELLESIEAHESSGAHGTRRH